MNRNALHDPLHTKPWHDPMVV